MAHSKGYKMQDVSFRNVDELLDYLPEDQLEIVNVLRSLCLDCIPGVTEKLSYNVPFYKQNKNIAFIWPGAVPWGKTTFEGVQLGFTQGHLLNDELHYLQAGKRKYVRTKTFKTAAEIDVDLVRHFLFEAVDVDGL